MRVLGAHLSVFEVRLGWCFWKCRSFEAAEAGSLWSCLHLSTFRPLWDLTCVRLRDALYKVTHLLQIIRVKPLEPIILTIIEAIVSTINITDIAWLFILVPYDLVVVLLPKHVNHWILSRATWSLDQQYLQPRLSGAHGYELLFLLFVDAMWFLQKLN